MGEVIVVTSGKGGVGKTTTVANLGVGLADLRKKVLLIDFDIGLRNLDILLGLKNQVVYDIIDVIDGTCPLEKALVTDNKYENLYFLPASQVKEKHVISPYEVINFCKNVKAIFDYIIIDCPAGIEHGFNNAISGADKAVIIVTPDESSMRDADRVIDILLSKKMEELCLIINRLRPEIVENGLMDIEGIIERLRVKLLGIVPEDVNVIISGNKGEPIVLRQDSMAGKGYRNITKRIIGNHVPIMDLNQKKSFSFLKGIFRK